MKSRTFSLLLLLLFVSLESVTTLGYDYGGHNFEGKHGGSGGDVKILIFFIKIQFVRNNAHK